MTAGSSRYSSRRATFLGVLQPEADYRARCEVQEARAELDRLMASRASAEPPSIAASPGGPLDPNMVEAGAGLGVSGELAGELLRLMERLAGLVDRRKLMRRAGWATATAAGALIS